MLIGGPLAAFPLHRGHLALRKHDKKDEPHAQVRSKSPQRTSGRHRIPGCCGFSKFPARGGETGLASATDLLAAVRQLIAGLEPDQRKAAAFAWDGPEWRGWNYFGSADFIKPGLRLEQMSASQKAAAWAVLATLLSPAGVQKAKNVMTLQDVLAARGNGAGQRSSQRFPSPSSARQRRPGPGAFASKGII